MATRQAIGITANFAVGAEMGIGLGRDQGQPPRSLDGRRDLPIDPASRTLIHACGLGSLLGVVVGESVPSAVASGSPLLPRSSRKYGRASSAGPEGAPHRGHG